MAALTSLHSWCAVGRSLTDGRNQTHNYSTTTPRESWRVCRTTTPIPAVTTSSVCGRAVRRARSPGGIPVGPSGASRSLDEADYLINEFEARPDRTILQ